MIQIDLPSLKTIELCRDVFEGVKDDKTCSLVMRSMNKWIEVIECRPSKTFQNYFRGLQLLFCIFYHIRKWTLLRELICLDIPNVRYAKLPHSFKNVIHPVVDSIPN